MKQLVGGFQVVMALIQRAPYQIKELYLNRERHDQRLQTLISGAEAHAIKVQFTSKEKLDAMLPGVIHQGVVAHGLFENQYQESDLKRLLAGFNSPFILILDNIQDPHNLGACLRTANAAGVNLVIASEHHSAGLTPSARKVACGAAEITPFIIVKNLARSMRLLKEEGIWLYGAIGEATTSLYDLDLKGPIALVVGAEDKGLRPLTRSLCDYAVAIPMYGQVESLNVSVAAAIFMYEASRQRHSLKV